MHDRILSLKERDGSIGFPYSYGSWVSPIFIKAKKGLEDKFIFTLYTLFDYLNLYLKKEILKMTREI